MAVAVQRGAKVRGDTFVIRLLDEYGAPIKPFSITFSIFDSTASIPYLEGDERRLPRYGNALGLYWAEFDLHSDANTGTWQLRWYIKRTEFTPEEVVVEDFTVLSNMISSTGFEASLPEFMRSLICQLRILLRDDNPDRNYHFRPPEHGVQIQNYTSRFGFIWESHQLLFALQMAVGAVNLAPPRTHFNLEHFQPHGYASDWVFLLLYKAAAIAARMVQTNWIADEFSYSIGSLSLDIERSSKYDQLASAWEQQFESGLELAKRTLKYTLGLRMPRFSGTSGMFSFGPSLNRVGLVNYPSLLRG